MSDYKDYTSKEHRNKVKRPREILNGDFVRCMTHKYRYLIYGQTYFVEKIRYSMRGNKNLVISDGHGNKFSYWAGNFIRVAAPFHNNVSESYSTKKYRFVIYDGDGNIEYQSNCIDCINTYVENQNKYRENYIC